MKGTTRSDWQLVERQLAKWHAAKVEKKEEEIKPGYVISISREAGCGASIMASKLAERLGMDLMGSRIIQMVAESADTSKRVVSPLDEKEITRRDDWLNSLFESRHLWPDRYLHHLTKVVATIGRFGNAVILGRGANFILPPGQTFAVRFIAPEAMRIQRATRTTAEEAQRYIIKADSDRRAFVRKYFHAEINDPVHYDLVLNMRGYLLDSAVDAVIAAFEAWKKKAPLP